MQPGIPAALQSGSDPVRALLARLRASLDERTFTQWIDGKTLLTVADDELTVGVANPFLLAFTARQFGAPFREAAGAVLGPSARVRFAVDSRVSVAPTCAEPQPAVEVAPPAVTRPARRVMPDLAEFIAGPGSEHALAAAVRFCALPAACTGLLFVHGGVGLGKTHLLEGIARRLREAGPGRIVTYITAEAFANYFTDALRNRTLPAFRGRFRSIDVLVMDDVDFFDGKRGLQDEFLHTLQQLESRGRATVLAADRHPKLLTRTGDDLTSRFVAGTVCRLDPPDQPTRLRILQAKAAKLPHPPGPATLDYIARRFKGGVRELEGALHSLEVYRGVSGRPAGVSAARRLLGDMERDCQRAVRVADIEQAVCEFFGLDADELRSGRRTRSLSQPRMLAMYLARRHTAAAYSEIGTHFGGRNHSTVIAAENKVKQMLAGTSHWAVCTESLPLSEVVRSIEARLNAG